METILEVLGGAILVVLLLGLAYLVFSIVCQWKIFNKMGEPGWKSLIPFYSQYVLYKHVWGHIWGFVALAALTVIPMIIDLGFIGTLASIAVFVINIITTWKMFKGFGKSTLFCVVGLFFTPINTAIVAFDKSEFVEPVAA